jgi:hypothetical protein
MIVRSCGIHAHAAHRPTPRRGAMGVAFVVLGLMLGLGAKWAERVAAACSCDTQGNVTGELVEIRRVSGSGDPVSQEWWGARLEIYIENESDASASTFEPLTPSESVDLALRAGGP